MPTWTPQTKNLSTWTDQFKQGNGWLYDSLDIFYEDEEVYYDTYELPITWTNQKHSIKSFLLKEDAFYLLLETGYKIILEPITGVEWTPQTKH